MLARCGQTVNRGGKKSDLPQAKRPRLSTNNAHSYPNVDEGAGEDEVSYKRHMELLDKEMKEHHPTKAKLIELMGKTFSERRKWITSSAISASQVWTKFPLLRKNSFVSSIF